MTREEELDWLCRLRSEIYVYMPKEWLIPMNNALDMAISDLSENKGEWIPVSENPKEYDRYLTYHKDGKMHVGTWGLFGWNYGHYVEDVIAWRPLPEPYKAEKGGE